MELPADDASFGALRPRHGGELLHAVAVAIVGHVPRLTLWHAVPAHPTVSKVWLHCSPQSVACSALTAAAPGR